jgi:hypothetical protein
MTTLPTDIARTIYKLACASRSGDIYTQIHSGIWDIMSFIPASRVSYTERPLYEGSLKRITIQSFVVDKIMQSAGVVTTRMCFGINDDEFEVTYNDYEGDAEVCMFVSNKDGLYADVVCDAFWAHFPNGTVY